MLWDPAEQSNTEEYIQQPILRPRIEESSLDDDQSDTNTPLSKSSTSDRAESPTSVHSTIIKDFRQHDEQVEEDEPRSYGNENRSDFGSTSQSDMDLGGWGTVGSWDNTASKSKSTSVSPTQKQQSQEGWGAESVTEWDHVKQQRQQHEQHQQSTSIDPPATPSLITSSAADVEGWGTPKDVVAWKDLRKQGYAYQVIEDQRKSFSSDNDRAWSAAISRTPSPRQQDTTTSPPRKSLLSPDDELIDWDDDDGVTILTETHTNTRMPTNTTTTTTRTQSPATGKMKGNSWMVCTPMLPPPTHPGNPKWSTAHEWMNKSQEGVIMIDDGHQVSLQDDDDNEGWFAGWSVVMAAELLWVKNGGMGENIHNENLYDFLYSCSCILSCRSPNDAQAAWDYHSKQRSTTGYINDSWGDSYARTCWSWMG